MSPWWWLNCWACVTGTLVILAGGSPNMLTWCLSPQLPHRPLARHSRLVWFLRKELKQLPDFLSICLSWNIYYYFTGSRRVVLTTVWILWLSHATWQHCSCCRQLSAKSSLGLTTSRSSFPSIHLSFNQLHESFNVPLLILHFTTYYEPKFLK